MAVNLVRKVLIIGAAAVLLLAAATVLANVVRSRACFLYQSAVGDMRALVTSMIQYQKTYNAYPPSLAALGPPPANQLRSAEHAGLIDAKLASGNRGGYLYQYQRKRRAFSRKFRDGYVITADPLGEPARRHYYFVNETGIVRSEDNRPANSASPRTHDVSCTCDSEPVFDP
jgi:hypothetical protein